MIQFGIGYRRTWCHIHLEGKKREYKKIWSIADDSHWGHSASKCAVSTTALHSCRFLDLQKDEWDHFEVAYAQPERDICSLAICHRNQMIKRFISWLSSHVLWRRRFFAFKLHLNKIRFLCFKDQIEFKDDEHKKLCNYSFVGEWVAKFLNLSKVIPTEEAAIFANVL